MKTITVYFVDYAAFRAEGRLDVRFDPPPETWIFRGGEAKRAELQAALEATVAPWVNAEATGRVGEIKAQIEAVLDAWQLAGELVAGA